MLENTIENGEKPEELLIYAGLAKAARDWTSYERIVSSLLALGEDQTLVVQSGQPVGVFPSAESSPLVLMATSNLVGRWATAQHFYELERSNKIIWGGYTAGDWQYIGSQGIVQGTYQTLAVAAATHFGGSLAGKIVVTAGLGGMGGAQPLAITMAGGVGICVEVDPSRIQRRIETGYLQKATASLDEALQLAAASAQRGSALSIGLRANAAEALPAMRERGFLPDIVTDQTSAHDLLYGYVPRGIELSEMAVLRAEDPERLMREAASSIAEHVRTILEWQDAGAVAFEYGNNIRAQALAAGVDRAFDIPIFVERYIRPLFCRGIGPFRWVAVSGEPSDIAFIDDLVMRESDDDAIVRQWIPLAQQHVRFQGLPARIAWLGHGSRSHIARLVNRAVADGDLAGPIAFTRDHLDAGGVAQPLRETEGLLDGTDAVADWPLLNALLNSGGGADLVAVHGGGGGYAGYYQSSGLTIVADGAEATAERIERVLDGDTGIGVLRYADAGYGDAIAEVARSELEWISRP